MPVMKVKSKKEINNQSLGVFRKLQLKQNPSVMLYPASPLSGQALQGSAEIPLWRNAIIKNDINLEDIYQKNTDKNVILNPII